MDSSQKGSVLSQNKKDGAWFKWAVTFALEAVTKLKKSDWCTIDASGSKNKVWHGHESAEV